MVAYGYTLMTEQVVAQKAATMQLLTDGRFPLGVEPNPELPVPDGFAAATGFTRPEDVADSIACGPAGGASPTS